jgi:hypothetical protein
MATRQLAFQRKGAPVDDAADPEGAGDAQDSGSEGQEGDTCPNCGCVFDPDTGDVSQPGKPVKGGGDEYSPDGKGGPDLQLPEPTPDAQAPVGMDAVTQALAGVLAQHGR